MIKMGTVHAGTIYGTRFRVGARTDQDIFFEDSGIRLYDVGSNQLKFYKEGLADLSLYFSNGVRLHTDGDFVSLNPGSNIFSFAERGVSKYPVLTAGEGAGPAGVKGNIAFRDYGDKCRLMIHDGTGWRFIENSASNW